MPVEFDPAWEYFQPDPEFATGESGGGGFSRLPWAREETDSIGFRFGRGNPNFCSFRFGPARGSEWDPPAPAISLKRCVECNRLFKPTRPTKRFCATACAAARRARWQKPPPTPTPTGIDRIPPLVDWEQDLVTEYLAKWNPLAVAYRKAPKAILAAKACGIGDDDLGQMALLGVIVAATRYDGRDVKFATYANWYVRYAVQSFSRCHTSQARFESAFVRGDWEYHERETNLWGSLPDERAGGVGESAESDPDQTVANALAALPPRLRLVVELKFGLIDDRPLTLREIAGVIGVSHERTRQILIQATAIMRRAVVRDTRADFR